MVAQDTEPDRPTELHGSGWRDTLRRSATEFKKDNLPDWAAALTYYGVLSIFPGLLVLVSALGLLGSRTAGSVESTITAVAPGRAGQLLDSAIQQVQANGRTAGVVAIVSLLVAFWSASNYIAAFIRAMNAIYDVPEGRPIWKTLPLRLLLTAGVGLMLIVSALIVVFTGNLATRLGQKLGIGQTAITVWSIAKWPVLVVLVAVMIAVLYWAAPNARQGGFRWISPGGILAVLVWIIISAGFALYVSHSGSYDRTYGALAGVIIFLIWLWLTNTAILLGAELDAELQRTRAIEAGHSGDDPYLELRDDRRLRQTRRLER